MSKVFDKAVTIQRMDEETGEWMEYCSIHAYINKAKTDSQYLNAGSSRSRNAWTFGVRWSKKIEAISHNLQLYRIIYSGVTYTVKDYDDFRMSHKTVTLLGESINE